MHQCLQKVQENKTTNALKVRFLRANIFSVMAQRLFLLYPFFWMFLLCHTETGCTCTMILLPSAKPVLSKHFTYRVCCTLVSFFLTRIHPLISNSNKFSCWVQKIIIQNECTILIIFLLKIKIFLDLYVSLTFETELHPIAQTGLKTHYVNKLASSSWWSSCSVSQVLGLQEGVTMLRKCPFLTEYQFASC